MRLAVFTVAPQMSYWNFFTPEMSSTNVHSEANAQLEGPEWPWKDHGTALIHRPVNVAFAERNTTE